MRMKLKRKIMMILLSCVFMIGLLPITGSAEANVWTAYAADDFAGGSGTQDEPYQIATAAQLALIAKNVADGTADYYGKYFKLVDNIDLSGHYWSPIGVYSYTPSGTESKIFEGFIDGNNKVISGLVVDERTSKNSAGFFGNIQNYRGSGAGAKDLSIVGAKIYAAEDGLKSVQAGILAGFSSANEDKEKITFDNITVSGSVNVESTDGYNNIGGMIGYGARINATNCKTESVAVSGGSNSGGFIGVSVGSAFTNCTAAGTVSGLWSLGGFAGYSSTSTEGNPNTQSLYKNCAANVAVSGCDWRLGGFVGYSEYGRYTYCKSYGDIKSTVSEWEPKAGGFIGESVNVFASDCYSTGKVNFISTEDTIKTTGGFVGDDSSGDYSDCSCDMEKNKGLSVSGKACTPSGIRAVEGSDVCNTYYGGHQYDTDWTVDLKETCTVNGSKSHYCKNCGQQADVTEIPAAGHKWDEGVVMKEPTQTEEGEKTYTCSVCKETKTEALPKAETQNPPETETPAPQLPKKGDVVLDDTKAAKVEITDEVTKEAAYKEPANKKAKVIVIPGTVKINGEVYKVTQIANNAFKGNKNVKKVTMGSSIKAIGKNVFSGASKLNTVVIGKNVTAIGSNVFSGCKKLTTITIKSLELKAKTVSKNAFKGITGATTIKVPKKKLSAYKQLFKKKGLSSQVKMKAY